MNYVRSVKAAAAKEGFTLIEQKFDNQSFSITSAVKELESAPSTHSNEKSSDHSVTKTVTPLRHLTLSKEKEKEEENDSKKVVAANESNHKRCTIL